MSRETRKANLRKLQLPTTSSAAQGKEPRKTNRTSPSVSNFFTTPRKQSPPPSCPPLQNEGSAEEEEFIEVVADFLAQEPKPPCIPPKDKGESEKPLTAKRVKRTKMTTFLRRDDEDFELPLPKPIKAAPKTKRATTKSSTTAKTTKSNQRQKQPNIKSAFLRNEQMFSEITAQHCIADNFNPDEVELALALSQSEAQARLGGQYADLDEDEVVVDVLDGGKKKGQQDANETIRTKLQKYGFRTGNREDYNKFTETFLPGVKGSKRNKTKWANKFTALTLRNPEIQLVKLNQKIAAFLEGQFTTRRLTEDESQVDAYVSLAPQLKKVQVTAKHLKILKSFEEQVVDSATILDSFFVQPLCEVTQLPAGHLLKNWQAIQGRDFSPPRKKDVSLQRMKDAYENLQRHFEFGDEEMVTDAEEVCDLDNNEIPEEEEEKKEELCELDEMLELIEKLPPTEISIMNCSPLSDELKIEESVCELPTPTSPVTPAPTIEKVEEKLPLTPKKEANSQPCISPDLFADSDIEEEPENSSNLAPSTLTTQESNRDGDPLAATLPCSPADQRTPTTPVKIPTDGGSAKAVLDMSIDLTQDDEVDPGVANQSFGESQPLKMSKRTDEELENDLLYKSIWEAENDSTASSNDSLSSLDDDADGAVPAKISRDFNKSILASLSQKYLNPKTAGRLSLNKAASATELEKSFCAEDDLMMNVINQSFTVSQQDQKSFRRRSRSATLLTGPSTRMASSAKADLSIDLTQSDGDEEVYDRFATRCTDADECLVLSDDEINYSIWKADKIQHDNTVGRREEKNGNEKVEKSEQFSSTNKEFSVRQVLADDDKDSNDDIATLSSTDNEEEMLTGTGKTKTPAKSIPSTTGATTTTPNCTNQAEFGILHSHSDLGTSNTPNRESSDVEMNCESVTPRRSREMSYKFSGSAETAVQPIQIDDEEEPDEFDRLIYGTPQTKRIGKANTAYSRTPSGLDKLLTADISFVREADLSDHMKNDEEATKQEDQAAKKSKEAEAQKAKKNNHAKKKAVEEPQNTDSERSSTSLPLSVDIAYLAQGGSQDIVLDGHECTITLSNSPKPDYINYTEAELEKALSDFGIRSLKRKNAVKILEYIFTQTHIPIDVDAVIAAQKKRTEEGVAVEAAGPVQTAGVTAATAAVEDADDDDVIARLNAKYGLSTNKASGVTTNDKKLPRQPKAFTQPQIAQPVKVKSSSQPVMPVPTKPADDARPAEVCKFNLQDCGGDVLLCYEMESCAQLLPQEEFILQTNVTKKTARPLLPFHIAWYNLVCSSLALHEAILCFDPIDLQEVYQFLKQLGYRYEPKDMKSFLDRRCIIFRYELGGVSKHQKNRHERKKKTTQPKVAP